MLQGLKVVEFATYVAGPGAGAVLADWGADVVKIERSVGDPTRNLFDARPEFEGNPVFEFKNHSKRYGTLASWPYLTIMMRGGPMPNG